MSRGSIIRVLVTLIIGGFFGAAIAYLLVPLNWGLLIVAAVLGMVCYAGGWQLLHGRNAPLLRTGLAFLPVALILLFVAWTGVVSYNAGQIAAPVGDNVYSANFDRLWLAMNDNYPYFALKGVDWVAVRTTYQPQVARVADKKAYDALIASMLATLNDGHTYFQPTYDEWVYRFGALAEVEGKIVVWSVGNAAQQAGLKRGDIVLRINSKPVDAAISSLPLSLQVGSTPWNSRALALAFVLILREATDVLEVELQDQGGATRTVKLSMPPASDQPDSAFALSSYRLPSGVGVIRIPNFSSRFVATFDAALDSLQDASGLIIDIRGNSGGNSLSAGDMAGRFIAAPFDYAREYYRQRLPQRAWLPFGQRTVSPRGAQFTKPVMIVADALTFSTAEEFVLMLVDSGRAQMVGRTTGGGSGNPLNFPLAGGGFAKFSSGDLRRVNGERIEGQGIAPNVPVTWTVADLVAGRDPDISAAEAAILAR